MIRTNMEPRDSLEVKSTSAEGRSSTSNTHMAAHSICRSALGDLRLSSAGTRQKVAYTQTRRQNTRARKKKPKSLKTVSGNTGQQQFNTWEPKAPVKAVP